MFQKILKSKNVASIWILTVIVTIMIFPINAGKIVYSYAPMSIGPKWENNEINDLTILLNSSLYYKIRMTLRRAIGFWNSFSIVNFVPTWQNVKIRTATGFSQCGAVTIVYVANGYIVGAQIKYGSYYCSPNFNWWIAVSSHELGHTLGLGHNKGAPSIMGDGYNYYGIVSPMYDDIIALWMLYGRGSVDQPSMLGHRGSYSVEDGGPTELGSYPYTLKISPGSNNYVFYGYTKDLYGRYGYILSGYVSPKTVYRGAIGIWTSSDATSLTNRAAIVEFSGSGNDYYIALTYTSSSSGQTPRKIATYQSDDPLREGGFFVMLIFYLDEYYWTRVLVVVYRGTEIEAYVPASNAPKLYHCILNQHGTRYIGFAVWTDNSNNPSSQYLFGPIWAG